MNMLTRRKTLTAIATLPAITASVAAAAVAEPHDPLLDAISAWKAAEASFNAHHAKDKEDEDRWHNEVLLPPLERLENWDRPAISYRGALAALTLAHEENQHSSGTQVMEVMVWAALSYFEERASSKGSTSAGRIIGRQP